MRLLDTIPDDWPMNEWQKAVLSKMFQQWDQDLKRSTQTIVTMLTILPNEYCDRCDTYRFRNVKNRLTCDCPDN
jgi:hypothetical protein